MRCGIKREIEKDFTDLKIQDAFFTLPKNKTYGSDRYSAAFFKSNWPIVGPKVIEVVKEFVRSGQLLKQRNATHLVLIQKTSNASSAADFRPISRLNTLYKVTEKLLTRRLHFLSQVISPTQSAFLPDRLLFENVLLATKIVY